VARAARGLRTGGGCGAYRADGSAAPAPQRRRRGRHRDAADRGHVLRSRDVRRRVLDMWKTLHQYRHSIVAVSL